MPEFFAWVPGLELSVSCLHASTVPTALLQFPAIKFNTHFTFTLTVWPHGHSVHDSRMYVGVNSSLWVMGRF